MMLFVLPLVGLVTGMVTGITGASGVMVLVPLLTLIIGVPIHAAIGTSLLVDVLVSIPVAATYYRYRHTNIRAAIILALGSILGAQVGAREALDISGGFLFIGLALFMVFFGVMLWRKGLAHHANQFRITLPFTTTLERHGVSFVLGIIIGVLTGVFGAGGGLLMFLALYYILQLPLKIAIGTSTIMMVITAASGVLAHSAQGTIDVQYGLIIGVSAAIGGLLSSHIANRISDNLLAKLVGAVFIVIAALMTAIKILGWKPIF